MATIHIGSDFKELRLREKGGFVFANEPYAVLFNKQKGMYYAADDYTRLSDGYDVNWTSDVTEKMIPGIYTLEVYADSTKKDMFYRKEAYATAVIVAASPEQEDGNPNT